MSRRRRFTIAIVLLLGIALLLGIIATTWQRAPAVEVFPNRQLDVMGESRSYRLVVPRKTVPPMPVVFAFHGMGDSPESFARYSNLDALAGAHGFLLVYPRSRRSMWATVDIAGQSPDENDDVRFFDRLLEHLAASHPVDRQRVFVIGMSNGGTFAQRLLTSRSDVVAAAVSQAGARGELSMESPHRRPILLLVGEDDPALPSMRADFDAYRAAGHSSQWIQIRHLGHAWSPHTNEDVWKFLAAAPKLGG